LPGGRLRQGAAILCKIERVSPTIELGAPAEELPLVNAGLLPERYGRQMQDVFAARLQPLLAPRVAILDVGAGRYPTLAPTDRPSDCRYVGLDIEPDEIAAAGPAAYDESIVADVTAPLGRDEEFDLVLSWQVLEHVSPLAEALENLRRSLRPGGTLLAQLTGSNAAFAILGRLLPHRAKLWVATRLLGHSEEEKFPTRYDRSSDRALTRLLEPWSGVEIIPFYRGAVYFKPLRPLMRAYIAYEDMVVRRQAKNLATHYLIVAKR
jgi:SAM-dependent methyltransferase